MPDPDLEISGGGWRRGGGERGGDPVTQFLSSKWGALSPKIFSRPLEPPFGLKIRGEGEGGAQAPHQDPPLELAMLYCC